MPSTLRRHDEFGHVHFLTICCYRRLQFFRHDIVKLAFVDATKRVRVALNIRWLGYVIMPEHVHLLVFPQAIGAESPTPISTVLRHLKGTAGRLGKHALREVWRARRTLGTRALDRWATGSGGKPFWKPRGYDFNVIDEVTVREKLDYLHANPVRRGLVKQSEKWPWSSYRFYELGDASPVEMDWDGSSPIEV